MPYKAWGKGKGKKRKKKTQKVPVHKSRDLAYMAFDLMNFVWPSVELIFKILIEY